MTEYVMIQRKQQSRNLINQIHQYKKLQESEFPHITNR